jgi:hypothetical protein
MMQETTSQNLKEKKREERKISRQKKNGFNISLIRAKMKTSLQSAQRTV